MKTERDFGYGDDQDLDSEELDVDEPETDELDAEALLPHPYEHPF